MSDAVRSIAEVAEPRKPLVLVGFSGGVVTATAAAAQLLLLGYEVLGIVADSGVPARVAPPKVSVALFYYAHDRFWNGCGILDHWKDWDVWHHCCRWGKHARNLTGKMLNECVDFWQEPSDSSTGNNEERKKRCRTAGAV